MSDSNLDQTGFIEQAALQEDASAPSIKTNHSGPSIQAPESETPTPVAKKKGLPPLALVALGIVGIFVFLLIIVAVLSPKTGTGGQLTAGQATPTPTPQASLPPQLQKSIDTLTDDISSADPQNNDLPFPPVNFQLHLVPPPVTNNQQ